VFAGESHGNSSLSAESETISTADETTPHTDTPVALPPFSPPADTERSLPAAMSPFSPPADTERSLPGSRKRKRHSTFTKDTPTFTQLLSDGHTLEDSDKAEVAMEINEPERLEELEMESPDEKRRLTFDVLPSPKKARKDSAESADVMAELQNLLDNRVKEVRKSPLSHTLITIHFAYF